MFAFLGAKAVIWLAVAVFGTAGYFAYPVAHNGVNIAIPPLVQSN